MHFQDGGPTAEHPYPTLSMGYALAQSTPTSRKLPSRSPIVSQEQTHDVKAISTDQAGQAQDMLQEGRRTTTCRHDDHPYSGTSLDDSCATCITLSRQLLEERKKNLELIRQLEEKQDANVKPTTCRIDHMNVKKSIADQLTENDMRVRQNTGLPNKAALYALLKHVSPKAEKMRYWTGSKKVRVLGCRNFKRTPKKFGP